MSQMITLKRPDGASLEAYLSHTNPSRPCVIVLQEWWGLNANIKAIVDRLSDEGFNALAPDLYHGRVAKTADEASHMMDGLDFPGAVHEDVASARDYLKALNPKTAIIGYCMGGALTIASAVRLTGFDAAICFYGMPPKAFADPKDITIPFQGHFGTLDDWITPDVVAAMRADMTQAGNTPDFYSYEADHAFCNSARPEVYRPEAAELAWTRMIAFLRSTL